MAVRGVDVAREEGEPPDNSGLALLRNEGNQVPLPLLVPLLPEGVDVVLVCVGSA